MTVSDRGLRHGVLVERFGRGIVAVVRPSRTTFPKRGPSRATHQKVGAAPVGRRGFAKHARCREERGQREPASSPSLGLRIGRRSRASPIDPGRGAAAPGLLLRHAEPRPRQGRARRACAATHPGRPRGPGRRSAAPVVPNELARRGPSIRGLQRRGRSRCRRLRLLRFDEGAEQLRRDQRRRSAARFRCGRSSPRSSERSSPRTRRPASSLDALVPLGPTYVLKLVWVPKDLGRKFVAELWLYQDGSRILELSTKCLPSETFQVAAEARAYLSRLGVKFAGSQQTKTRTALEFFQADLRGTDAGGAGHPRRRGPAGRDPRARHGLQGRPAGDRQRRPRRRPRPRHHRPRRPPATATTPAPTVTGGRRTTTGAAKTTRATATDPACGNGAEGVGREADHPRRLPAPKTGGTTRRTRRPSA